MKAIQLASKTNIQSSAPQEQVSINILNSEDVVGVINLSGQWKSKVEQIINKWNSVGPNVGVINNSFGSKKGFQIISGNGVLVGFLNFFTSVTLEEAITCFSTSSFELHKGADIDTI